MVRLLILRTFYRSIEAFDQIIFIQVLTDQLVFTKEEEYLQINNRNKFIKKKHQKHQNKAKQNKTKEVYAETFSLLFYIIFSSFISLKCL